MTVPERKDGRTGERNIVLTKKILLAFLLYYFILVLAVQRWTVVSNKHHQTKNPPFGGVCGISTLCVSKKQDC